MRLLTNPGPVKADVAQEPVAKPKKLLEQVSDSLRRRVQGPMINSQ